MNTSQDNYLIRTVVYLLAYLIVAAVVFGFMAAIVAVFIGPFFLAGALGWPLWVSAPVCVLVGAALAALSHATVAGIR